MEKPFVFCHMMTSLDGKIVGNFMKTEAVKKSGEVFFDLAFGDNPYYNHQGWLSGRATTDDNFTQYKVPNLNAYSDEVPKGDYIVKTNFDKYYISVDASGKLGWEKNYIDYQGVKAHVLEVLTDKASDAYKAMLRDLEIPYIIAGQDSIDFKVVLEKLKNEFGIDTMMLGGGGKLNWSFIQAGLCDEVSIVLAPAADGKVDAPSLFDTQEGSSDDNAVTFDLKQIEDKGNSTLWLRYGVNNK